MAYTPKKKKLEKKPDKVEAELPIQSSTKFYCCRCGTAYSRRKGYFPVSHSPMYRGSGFLPICNDCVEQMYEQYRAKLGDDRAAMRRMCMKMDLYWNDSIYDMVERTAGTNSRVRNYIGKTNIVRYIDKNFDNTIEEEEKANIVAQYTTPTYFSESGEQTDRPDAIAIDHSTIDFWGPGYTPEFYADLDRRYKSWTNDTKIEDPSERALYRQICLLEAIIARDGAQGKPIDKNVNALNSLLGSMNLKPVQKKADGDAEIDGMPLGVGIQKWEFSRPLPETPKKLQDQTGIIKNITTWFLGHACKMVGLKNSYCKQYEEAMEEFRVKRPEYADEDDDTVLSDIFSGVHTDQENAT